MPTAFQVKPTHKAVKTYYAALETYADHSVEHEGALRSAFQNLLADTGRKVGWTLIPELSLDANGHSIRPDGTFRDEFTIERGYWEAKDTADDLEAEIKKKIKRGYRLTNIIFEDTREARLYQDGKLGMIADLSDPQALCDLLNTFFSHTEPAHEDFNKAVDEFKQRVPDLARGLVALIDEAHKNNPGFIEAFEQFHQLCKSSLNPNLSTEAVDEMLVQHLLTERLIRTVFDSQDFTRRNVIAAEIEKVIDALVSKSFNRHEYVKRLDRFYVAIEQAARTLSSFSEKQHFLNVVYERFFQGYSVKVADTHGIVYTPQEIVDFMCASVEEVLKTEFGKKLGDPDVNILDPCTGTGNFIVNLIGRIPKRSLTRMYREQLFANEVMLLPYYIAALNIEHAFYEKTGEYEPFEGLCFVDSLDLAEDAEKQFGFMTEENTQRVERQRKAPITVIIANPPYNVRQLSENDNNKNRKYPHIEKRIRDTYARDSNASNKNPLSDPYVKFFRWAADRLSADGIACFVSNNSLVDQLAFDGMRKHLLIDFTRVYHVHLEGNVRHNPTLSGTAYNVFGIQVGVGITIAVRSSCHRNHRLCFHRVNKRLRKEKKLAWLASKASLSHVCWDTLTPTKEYTWLKTDGGGEFGSYVPIGSRATKAAKRQNGAAIFKTYSMGVSTNRDSWVYSFDTRDLLENVQLLIQTYNSELDRWKRADQPTPIEDFVITDDTKIKWSSRLKETFLRKIHASFDEDKIRRSAYRPFTSKWLFFDSIVNHRRGIFPRIFPTVETQDENTTITLTDVAGERPFMLVATDSITDLHFVGAGCGSQCFPFYVYDEDGTNRRENITDWALKHFREHYGNPRITKWDIFYYVYGVLHHPGYREKFAGCLKRELPRIPLAPPLAGDGRPSRSSGFRVFAKAGKKLAKLHLEYESLEEWPLEWIETPDQPLSYRVEKMRLGKDKKSLTVNDSLTLAGIPPEVFEYRLGNRSALDWVIDQYRVKEDKRSGIVSDPNNSADPEYIVRLVRQVVRVSIETVKLVAALPKHYAPP